jgi:hypothetical protein
MPKKKTTDEFIKEVFNLVGDEYEVLDEYVNDSTPISFLHNECGNEFGMRPGKFLGTPNCKGNRCPYCYGTPKKTTKRFKIEVKNLTNDGYDVLDEYKTNKDKMRFKHKECDTVFEMSPNNFLNSNVKTKCPVCRKKELKEIKKTTLPKKKPISESVTSNEEIKPKVKTKNTELKNKLLKEFIDFIKKIYKGEISINEKEVIKGFNFEVYVPEKKIAFNFISLTTGTTRFVDRTYYRDMMQRCNEEGIRLLQIFEDEWLNKSKIIKDKCKYTLGLTKSTKRIYARNCYVEEITKPQKRDFLNKNHIQGNDAAQILLGLWYKVEDEEYLVAVMTFCKPRIFMGMKNSSYDYELSRFATCINYSVIGAFSKIFAYFKKQYEWNKLVTYADRRLSNGNLYLKNGFINDHNSDPNYFYIAPNSLVREYRYGYRKQKLQEKFPDIYLPEKTEKQILEEANYSRIYDCGNMVFIYNR